MNEKNHDNMITIRYDRAKEADTYICESLDIVQSGAMSKCLIKIAVFKALSISTKRVLPKITFLLTKTHRKG